MNFIPSRSYFQDQQLCTFRFFVRIPFTSLGRQNYLAPNAHFRKARKHAMHGRDATSAKYSVANRVISRKLYMRSLSFLHHFVGLINTNNYVGTEYFSDSCNVSKVDKSAVHRKNACDARSMQAYSVCVGRVGGRSAKVQCCKPRDISKTIHAIFVIFTPSCRAIQYEQMCTYRIFVRLFQHALDRQEYSASIARNAC